jgi:hypothetical protein
MLKGMKAKFLGNGERGVEQNQNTICACGEVLSHSPREIKSFAKHS